MRKFYAVLSSLGISLLASTAHGQCELEDVPEPHRAILTLEDASGVWFVGPLARCLLRDVELLQVREEEVALLEEQLNLFRSRSEHVDLALVTAEGEVAALGESLERMTERVVAAEAWWMSPWLWTTVGIVLGVTGSIVLSIAI